jgi:molybdenum cofactor cytidylyltransferase
MGQPKMLLRWGETTVLGHVIDVFRQSGIEDILVVTGGAREQVEEIVRVSPARSVFNEGYSKGEMLVSLQRGIQEQSHQTQATLIALGDQPQVQAGTVRLICETFQRTKSKLIVPSFQMRRGHPWLLERSLWNEVLEMDSQRSPRQFLNQHAHEIEYVSVETASVLSDLDTMADYHRTRPQV